MGLSPKEVKIKVNHSLTLECEAHAIPTAAISWYKDGQASHKLNFFSSVAFDRNNCVCAVCEHSCSRTGPLPLLKSAGKSSSSLSCWQDCPHTRLGTFAVCQISTK